MDSEAPPQALKRSRSRAENLHSSLVFFLHRFNQSLGGLESSSLGFIFTEKPCEMAVRGILQQFPDGVFLGQELIEILAGSAPQSVVLRLSRLKHHLPGLVATAGTPCDLTE